MEVCDIGRGWDELRRLLGFAGEPGGKLRVASNRRKTEPRSGWTVIALVPPAAEVNSIAAAAAAVLA